MTEKNLLRIEEQIAAVKQQLMEIGEMRPGSLTKQYKNPKEKKGGFYQISYTQKNKSKTEYVRPYHIKVLKQQIKSYKKWKLLVERWIDLSIEFSKLKMDIANQSKLK
jgi:hypothetical protein